MLLFGTTIKRAGRKRPALSQPDPRLAYFGNRNWVVKLIDQSGANSGLSTL
jgi:hypothetical protein